MLGWALTFLVIAIVAAVLGMGSVAVLATDIAQLLFVVFIVLFVIATIIGAVRGRTPTI